MAGLCSFCARHLFLPSCIGRGGFVQRKKGRKLFKNVVRFTFDFHRAFQEQESGGVSQYIFANDLLVIINKWFSSRIIIAQYNNWVVDNNMVTNYFNQHVVN